MSDESLKEKYARLKRKRENKPDEVKSEPAPAPAPTVADEKQALLEQIKQDLQSAESRDSVAQPLKRIKKKTSQPVMKLPPAPAGSTSSAASSSSSSVYGSGGSQQKQGDWPQNSYQGGRGGHFNSGGRGRGRGGSDGGDQKRRFPKLNPATPHPDTPMSTMSYADRTTKWTKGFVNPHLAQYFENPDNKASSEPFSRVLAADAPGLPYRRRREERKSVIHWGQRKLLMHEIEFLTQYAFPGAIILYAGAAPGIHIGLLADMFPECTFILVDPNDVVCRPSDRIEIRKTLFTDALAAEFAAKDIREKLLFVSDVRDANWFELTESELEAAVKGDMDNQMRWYQTLMPKHAILKFRLPWFKGATQYLDGKIHLPVWGPQTTTETRLVPTSYDLYRDWDNTVYESQMFRHNTFARVQCYPHQVVGEGLDHCFDCASEIEILRKYLEKYHAAFLDGTGDHPRAFIAQNRVIREAAEKKWAESNAQAYQPISNDEINQAGENKYATTVTATDTHADTLPAFQWPFVPPPAPAEDKHDPTYDASAYAQPFPTPYPSDEASLQRLPRLLRAIAELSFDISRFISPRNRTLLTHMPAPEHRLRFPNTVPNT